MGASPEALERYRETQRILEEKVRKMIEAEAPHYEEPPKPKIVTPIRPAEAKELPRSAKTLVKMLEEYEWDYRTFYNVTLTDPVLFMAGDRKGEVRFPPKESTWITVIARRPGHPIIRVIYQTVGGKTQVTERRISSQSKGLSDKEMKAVIEQE